MSQLLEQLTHELGKDAVEEANRRHPELASIQPEHVAQLIDAVEYVIDLQGWPRTVENAERAYRVLEAQGELGRLTAHYAPAPAPEAFTPRADEEEFLRSAPLSEVRDYLLAKHQTEAP